MAPSLKLTLAFTAAAMVAFAGNSLLARAALAAGAADPATYTVVRLVSGAATLGLLVLLRRSGRSRLVPATGGMPGNWPSALALLAYAIAFSLAYVRIGAATGTLILFAAVQATMIGWGLLRQDRPTLRELAGVAIGLSGLAYLMLPGVTTPDPLGSALVIVSGVAWSVYSLRGRGVASPLDETAGNFLRAALLCLPLLLVFAAGLGQLTLPGTALAVASGAVASGLGYAIWYRALPGLTPTQAAVVQLTVPVIAALGAVLLLGEALTARLVVAAALILGGVALAILSRAPAPIPSPTPVRSPTPSPTGTPPPRSS